MNDSSNDIEEEAEGETAFADLYSSVSLNEEVIITIPKEEVTRVKVGLKNFKAKHSARMKANGLAAPVESFMFIERECEKEEYRDLYIDLVISLTRKSTVFIKEMRIPDNNF